MDRKEVYKIIDGERDYQEKCLAAGRWLRISKSPAEFLSDIRVYTRKAEEKYVNTGSDVLCMIGIRKIAALCVSAMERNTTPGR